MIILRIALALVFVATGQYLFVNAAGQFFSESLIFEAGELTKRDRYAQAEQAAIAATRFNPLNGYAQYQVASNRYLLDKYDEAAEQATRALPLMPHRANLLRLRGECYYQARQYDRAAADLLNYFALVPDPPMNAGHLMRIAAISLFQLKQAGQATYWLNRSAANAASFADAQRVKTDTALLLNDPEMAANAISSLLSRPAPNTINGPEHLKNAILSSKVTVFVQALEQISSRYRDSPVLVRTLAAAYVRSGKMTSAVSLLKQALAANDADADLHFMLGDLLYEQKNFGEAAQHYDRVLSLQPDSAYRQDIERRKADMR
ncbi:MAG: tetratricopeptide repeat protein [Candidatus Sumerlaeaceae bacterium]